MSETPTSLDALEQALADPSDDLAARVALLDDAARELRAALAALDGV